MSDSVPVTLPPVSVAVSNWGPAVRNVAEAETTPPDSPKSSGGGRVAAGSLLVTSAVPEKLVSTLPKSSRAVTVNEYTVPAVGVGGEPLPGEGVTLAGGREENSEVVPDGSVAVAVTTAPAGTALTAALKVAWPLASVVTSAVPRNVLPCRRAPPTGVEKNSRR